MRRLITIWLLLFVFSSHAQRSLSGHVYYDLNNNGIWDAGEPAVINQFVTYDLPYNYGGLTDSSGFYQASTNIFGGTIVVKPAAAFNAKFVPDSIILHVTSNYNDTGLNFGLQFVRSFSDVEVVATEEIRAIAGQPAGYNITVLNKGTRTESGVLHYTFNGNFTYVSAQPAATVAANVASWNFSNLLPGQYRHYAVVLGTGAGALPGLVFTDTAMVSIVNSDSFPASNTAVITDSVVTSYQRITKSVQPLGYNGVNFQHGDYLTYTINFQNTDTAIVGSVKIDDTLSTFLDPSTIEIIAASAPYTFTLNQTIYPPELTVYFNQINLPDSATSQAGSHGFLMFRIRPYSTNFTGNIKNIAYIYLDGKKIPAGAQTGVCFSDFTIWVYSSPQVLSSCGPPITGTATVYAYGGSNQSNYNYIWSNGVTGTIDTGLAPGQYYVTVTDQCGTTAVGMPIVDTLRMPDTLSCVIHVLTYPSCPNSSDGVIYAQVCGGTGPYSYFWPNPGPDTLRNISSQYNYYCTVTDALHHRTQCSTDNTGIASKDVLGLGVLGHSCQGFVQHYGLSSGPLGSASAYITGTPPFNILWSTGARTDSISNLHSGEYVVTVTDSVGCSLKDSVHINVLADINFQLSFNGGLVCYDSQTVELTYTLTGGDYNSHIQSFNNYANIWLHDTSYNYTIQVPYGFIAVGIYVELESDYGCLVDSSYHNFGTVGFDYNSPHVSYTSDCADSSNHTTITIFDANGNNCAFAWSNGFNDHSTSSSSLLHVPPGIYQCTVSDNYCSWIVDDTITGNDSLHVNVLSEGNLCDTAHTGNVRLQATSNISQTFYYRWSNNPFANNSAPVLTAGTYTCTITDNNNCSVIRSFTIQQDSLVILPLVQNATCYGYQNGSITVVAQSASGNFRYSWNDMSILPVDSDIVSGNYGCTVTDGSGCTASVTAFVGEDSLVVLPPVVKNATCYGNQNGSITVVAQSASGNFRYNWSDMSIQPVDSDIASGNYSCTVTDGSGCTASVTAFVAEPQQIIVVFSNDIPVCGTNSGSATIAGITGGTPPYITVWQTGDTGVTISNLSTGLYLLTVVDSNNCSYRDSDNLSCIESVSGIASSISFSLYPNPTTGQLIIETQNFNPQSITIYDDAGRLINALPFKNEIDISNLTSGAYFIEVTGVEGVARKRMMKM